MSQEYKQNLASARNDDRQKSGTRKNKKSLRKLAGDVAKEAGISNPAGLFKFILLNDLFFFFAIMMALLKDILDEAGFSIPPIGFVTTIMASITLMLAMLICGASIKQVRNKNKNKKLALKIVRKWGTLAGGTLFETVFGLNFLPVETLTACIIYFFILQERKIAYEAWEEEQREAQEQAEDFDMSPEYA